MTLANVNVSTPLGSNGIDKFLILFGKNIPAPPPFLCKKGFFFKFGVEVGVGESIESAPLV
jgi:hypothetical protein